MQRHLLVFDRLLFFAVELNANYAGEWHFETIMTFESSVSF